MATGRKSLVYSREENAKTQKDNQEEEDLLFDQPTLEGWQFPFSSDQPRPHDDDDDDDDDEDEEEDDSSSEEEIDENTDIFSPEFVRSRVVNMPELIELIKDPEVQEHLNNPKVSEYLREISLDPNNKIPELCDTPEIAFLKKKMEDLVKKTYPDAKVPVHFEKPPKK